MRTPTYMGFAADVHNSGNPSLRFIDIHGFTNARNAHPASESRNSNSCFIRHLLPPWSMIPNSRISTDQFCHQFEKTTHHYCCRIPAAFCTTMGIRGAPSSTHLSRESSMAANSILDILYTFVHATEVILESFFSQGRMTN